MIDDFKQRAAAVFGTADGGIRWPYGLETPNRCRSGLTRERFAQATVHADTAQRTIVQWAERYGLRATTIGCCQRWLGRPVSRRCRPNACRNHGGLDYVWLDHAIGWLKDSRPAVLTSAPYSKAYGPENHEIRECLDSDNRLRVVFGTGWYGHDTTQIVLWRTDRIGIVEPAGTAI